MTKAERDAAWREYAIQLGHLNVTGETLEIAEIDFKAGFDAGRNAVERHGERVAVATGADRVGNGGR